MFELMDTTSDRAILTIVNAGSKSSDVLEQMQKTVDGLEFLIDDFSIASNNRGNIKETIKRSDMVIIVTNLADQNESKLALTIAEVSKELEILTIIIGIMPELFPESKLQKLVSHNIKNLRGSVDSLLLIPEKNNESNNSNLEKTFDLKNNVIIQSILGITEMIYRPGLIRVDFADIRTVLTLQHQGISKMGFGVSDGKARATDAAKLAIASQALENIDLSTASGMIVTVRAGMNMSIGEFEEVGNIIKSFASDECTVVVGTIIETEMTDELQVIIVCTDVTV